MNLSLLTSQRTRLHFCLILVKGDNPLIFFCLHVKYQYVWRFYFFFNLISVSYIRLCKNLKKKNLTFFLEMHFRIAWKNKFLLSFLWGFIEFLSTSSRGLNFYVKGLCIWRNSQTEKAQLIQSGLVHCSLDFTL